MTDLATLLPGVKQGEPLSKYMQSKVGGPAEYMFTAKTTPDLIKAIRTARELKMEVTILGWGSNCLISDRGLEGLVILNRTAGMQIMDPVEGNTAIEVTETAEETMARLDQLDTTNYYDFKDLDYDESNLPSTEVYVESGVSLPLAILKTIKADLTGLQWYAGIPGTIGGAIYNNIHGGTHFFDEVVVSAEVLDYETLEVKTLTKEELGFDYDYSDLQKTKDYILSARLNLYHGDSEKALYVMQEWRKRKKLQPWISPGCVWKNLTEEQKIVLKLESGSMGYVIDKVLGLKGERSGDAIIAATHAAFIENTGKAKASDYLFLMKKIYYAAKEKLGVEIKPEIFLLGFDKSEITEFI